MRGGIAVWSVKPIINGAEADRMHLPFPRLAMTAILLVIGGFAAERLLGGGSVPVPALHMPALPNPALATLLVGGLGLITAIFAIRATRWATRAKATVDFLERLESQDIYRRRFERFRCFRRGCLTLAMLEDDLGRAEFTDRDLIHGHLNRWEFAGAACRSKIFDVAVLRRLSRTQIVADWQGASPLIGARRVAQPTAYENFEWLARRCGLHEGGVPPAAGPCPAGRRRCTESPAPRPPVAGSA